MYYEVSCQLAGSRCTEYSRHLLQAASDVEVIQWQQCPDVASQQRGWGGARAKMGAFGGRMYYEVRQGGKASLLLWAAAAEPFNAGGPCCRARFTLCAQAAHPNSVGSVRLLQIVRGLTSVVSVILLCPTACLVLCCAVQAEVCDEGLCRVGWSTLAASYDIGTDRHSFG